MKYLKGFIQHLQSDWLKVKESARNTVNKSGCGNYPSSEWKRKILLAEHSPIRLLHFSWRWEVPYWVSVHFVRHKHGIEHFVSTQRTDRTGEDRSIKMQDAIVSHVCEANAQALINISRKRLCNQAAKETREAWQEVKGAISNHEPELASVMVRECVYRGFCPEMYPCGYAETEAFRKERERYVKGSTI